jgi:hypothetical protein
MQEPSNRSRARCGRCRNLGHNRRTCPIPPEIPFPFQRVLTPPPLSEDALLLREQYINRMMYYQAAINRIESGGLRTSDYLNKTIAVTIKNHEDLPQECNICLDTFTATKIVYTNCNHTFCLDCVCDYTKSIKNKTMKPNCPCCRTILSNFHVMSQENRNILRIHLCTL